MNIPPRDASEPERAKECYAILAHDIVARGGYVAAEHGIGRIKKRLLYIPYEAPTMAALRSVKRWVDPEGRLNRGILLDP